MQRNDITYWLLAQYSSLYVWL